MLPAKHPRKVLIGLTLSVLMLGAGYRFYEHHEKADSIALPERDDKQLPPVMQQLLHEQLKNTPETPSETAAEALPGEQSIQYDKNPKIDLAIRYIGNFQWNDAESALLDALAEDADNQSVINLLVTVYGRGLKDYKLAADYAQKLVTLNPDYPVALARFHEMSSLAGRLGPALIYLESLPPSESFEVALTIGRIYKEQKRYGKAIEALEIAMARPGDEGANIQEEIAEIYQMTKQTSKARDAFMRAITAYEHYNSAVPADNPKGVKPDTTAVYAYIDSSVAMKDVTVAARMLARLISRDPQNPRLQEFQAKIEKISGQPLNFAQD